MAPSRIRNMDSEGPSTADVSMNEDAEITDRNGAPNGITKFSVSPQLRIQATLNLSAAHIHHTSFAPSEAIGLISYNSVLSRHAGLHGTLPLYSPCRRKG